MPHSVGAWRNLNFGRKQGKNFDIPETVPFRLTPNLVDGLGVTGVEGQYQQPQTNTDSSEIRRLPYLM